MGNIYHFKNHAFRHTKAVEWINKGLSLAVVQKLLGHLTAEMTLVYAQILEPTLREQWAKAEAQGVLRIDQEGQPLLTTPTLGDDQMIQWEFLRHNLEAIRLADGYCMLPTNLKCPHQAPACHSCASFCTTPDFLPEFRKRAQETIELLEVNRTVGRARSVELGEQQLAQVQKIIEVLEKGQVHNPMGQEAREYTSEEREQKDGNA